MAGIRHACRVPASPITHDMKVDDSIRVVPYDTTWPQKYEKEKTAILDRIGQYGVQLEHIGSTAIPGLGAKPIIDIMIGLQQFDDKRHCMPVLESMGYQYISDFETTFPDRRFFYKRSQNGRRTHQVHMVEIGCPFWVDHLLFRDYLRVHPDEAAEYYDLKLKLAGDYQTDRLGYNDAKTEFIQGVMSRAEHWRAQMP